MLKRCLFLLCCVTFPTLVMAQPDANPSEKSQWIDQDSAYLHRLYLDLHQHPELSFEERETGQRVADELEKAGAKVTRQFGGFGVVGVLANGPGPTVLIRADLDALPVTERTDRPYASTVTTKDADGSTVGVMHACGHDLHMTSLVGTARYLSQHKSQWSGTAVFIGQPAEERGAGAKAMIEAGLFEKFPKPDFALALHVTPSLPVGKIAVRAGYAMANVDSVDVILHGRGGHGAYPNKTIDPIVEAARFVLDIQTIVSREVGPLEPAVITVGAIHAGTKHNIIPDSCHLQLTVRSYTDSVRKTLIDGIRKKAMAAAASAGADEPTITLSEGTPALSNDPALVARLRPVLQNELGAENVLPAPQVMGGEDFSQYALQGGMPSLMFMLGAVEQKRIDRFAELGVPNPSLHSAAFWPDFESALVTGITATTRAACELMPPPK